MTAISLPAGFSSVLSTSPKTVRSTAKWLQSDRCTIRRRFEHTTFRTPRRRDAEVRAARRRQRREESKGMRFVDCLTAEGEPCTRTRIGTMQHSQAGAGAAHAFLAVGVGRSVI